MSALNLRQVDAAAIALRRDIAARQREGMPIRFHGPDSSAPSAGPQADARYIAFRATTHDAAGNPQDGWDGLIRCDEWLAGTAPALAALATFEGGDEYAMQLFAVTPQPLSAAFPYQKITVTGIVPGADLQNSPLAALAAPEATVWLRALPPLSSLPPAEQEDTAPIIAAWARDIPASLQFLLGESRLSYGCLSRVGPGDVLLISDHVLRMRCNGLIAGWYSITDEGITVDELLNEPYDKASDVALQASPEEGKSSNAIAQKSIGIARIPVRLEFVLQQNKITIGALGELHSGQVIDLAPDAEKDVLILANGAVLGRGELVQLEARLGVEIIELYGSDDHAD